MTWTRHRLQMKTRPCEHIRFRQSGVDPDAELPDNGQETGHHDRFSGCGAGVLARTWPVPHRSLRRRFCTLRPEAATPDQDPLHNRIDTRARTGRRCVIGSRRRASWPAPRLSRRRPNGHPGSATTGLHAKGRKQRDRDNGITTIGKKRGKPPRFPRIVPAANSPVLRPRSQARRASGNPVPRVPNSVIASPRASISSAALRRRAARSARDGQPKLANAASTFSAALSTDSTVPTAKSCTGPAAGRKKMSHRRRPIRRQSGVFQ